MINVKEKGAIGDGVSLDSPFIQKAIDQIADSGGGEVRFPSGIYLCGTIKLRNNINLHLEPGAIISGSDQFADYSSDVPMFIDGVGDKRGRCLLLADNVQNVSISGYGTIRGNGSNFSTKHPNFKERPFLLRFINSKQITLSNITLVDAAAWVSHYFDCEDVFIKGVRIRSHVNLNNDGIDIDSCRRVLISGCDIDTGDDAICIKTTSDKICNSIVITNCRMKSNCAAIKLGTESIGDMKNIQVTNCQIRDTNNGGVKLLSVDGSKIENIIISNLIMDNVAGPIMLRLGDRKRTYYSGQKPRNKGLLKNVFIENIFANVIELPKCQAVVCISGIPDGLIENVKFRNFRCQFPGGGKKLDNVGLSVPEKINAYPTFNMFGPLPAAVFFIRHAKNIQLEDIQLSFEYPEFRPWITGEDWHDSRMINVQTSSRALTNKNLLLNNCHNIEIIPEYNQ